MVSQRETIGTCQHPHSKKMEKKKPRLTERERGRIEGLHQAGLSSREVARLTSRSTHTVRRIISPVPVKIPKRPGPPPKLSDREARRLLRAASGGELSAAKLRTELKLTVSVRTIQRTLSSVDWLVYTKMVNTLPLKAEDMIRRKVNASAMRGNPDVLRKPSRQFKGGMQADRVVLEQLNINSASMIFVEHKCSSKRKAWSPYAEHLLVSSDDPLSIEDRCLIHTRFAWAFEADVTKAEQAEWAIVAATPFEENAMPLENK
ncbi:hypothetical protein BBJ28_00025958 [Nothophytophthora sp. Chile5]|nr:hypothetical protein BBJ28_00025958 [Nothophytophthora sp. Chile5]